MVEEAGDFVTLRIHDPVDAEVEVRLVEHKQFGQQLFEFIEVLFRHPSDPQFPEHYCTAHRMVNSSSVAVRWLNRFSNETINWSRLAIISSSTSKMCCLCWRTCFSKSRIFCWITCCSSRVVASRDCRLVAFIWAFFSKSSFSAETTIPPALRSSLSRSCTK